MKIINLKTANPQIGEWKKSDSKKAEFSLLTKKFQIRKNACIIVMEGKF